MTISRPILNRRPRAMLKRLQLTVSVPAPSSDPSSLDAALCCVSRQCHSETFTLNHIALCTDLHTISLVILAASHVAVLSSDCQRCTDCCWRLDNLYTQISWQLMLSTLKSSPNEEETRSQLQKATASRKRTHSKTCTKLSLGRSRVPAMARSPALGASSSDRRCRPTSPLSRSGIL